MAERQDGSGGGDEHRKIPSTLQQRAPAAIKVSPPERFANDLKVAIPLLSPLDLSSPGLPFASCPNTRVVVEKVSAIPTTMTTTSTQENESPRPLLDLHQCHPQQHPHPHPHPQKKKQTNSIMMWQHPVASPFHFDSTPSLMAPFVHDWRLGGGEEQEAS